MRLNVSSMPPPSSNMMGSRIIGSWLIPWKRGIFVAIM
jgi:hypothetical protein